jgi:hypothetical protein
MRLATTHTYTEILLATLHAPKTVQYTVICSATSWCCIIAAIHDCTSCVAVAIDVAYTDTAVAAVVAILLVATADCIVLPVTAVVTPAVDACSSVVLLLLLLLLLLVVVLIIVYPSNNSAQPEPNVVALY